MPYGQDQPVTGGYGQDEEVPQSGGLPVITDDGSNWAAPKGPPQPGIIQNIKDAWNSPGYLTPGLISGAASGAVNAVKSAFSMPHDVATGEMNLSDPSQAVNNAGRTFNAAALFSPSTPGVIGSGAPLNNLNRRGGDNPIVPPTADMLHTTGSGQFETANNAGVDFAPSYISSAAEKLQQALNASGRLRVNAPGTHSLLDDLQKPPQYQPGDIPGSASVPLSSVDAYRKSFGNLAADADSNTERRAAGTGKNTLLDLMANAPPESIMAGAAAAPGASDVLRAAIGNSAAGFRSDQLNGLSRTADLRAAAANSGANLGNNIRGRVASLLSENNAQGPAGYSPDEIAALESVTKGTPAANSVRWAANALGGGGGIGHTFAGSLGAGIGSAVGGEAGAMVGAGTVGAIGPALKAVQNRMDAGRLSQADALVRQRSPLYQAMTQGAPTAPVFPSTKNALVRALMAQQGQQQP